MEWRVPSQCAILGRGSGRGANGISCVSTNAEGAVILVVPRASHNAAQRRVDDI